MQKELIWKINRNMAKGSNWSLFWNHALYNEESGLYKVSPTATLGIWKNEDEDEGSYTVVVYDFSDHIYETMPMSYNEAVEEAKIIRDKVDSVDKFDELIQTWFD